MTLPGGGAGLRFYLVPDFDRMLEKMCIRDSIYTERNGIYIIDLQKTVKKLEEAYNFVRDTSANGGNILFVGTKMCIRDRPYPERRSVCPAYGLHFLLHG